MAVANVEGTGKGSEDLKQKMGAEDFAEVASNFDSNSAWIIEKRLQKTWRDSAAADQARQSGTSDTRATEVLMSAEVPMDVGEEEEMKTAEMAEKSPLSPPRSRRWQLLVADA